MRRIRWLRESTRNRLPEPSSADATRQVQRGCRCGGSVAREAGLAGAGDRDDDAGDGVDPADALVVGVGEEEISLSVDCDAGGRVDGSLGGGGSVAGIPLDARSRYRGDETSGAVDAADNVGAGANPHIQRGAQGRAILSCGMGSSIFAESLCWPWKKRSSGAFTMPRT